MKRDLPKTTAEALSPSLRRFHGALRDYSFAGGSAGVARVETLPGAACCQDLQSYTRRGEYRDVFEPYAKAAPLQALRNS